MLFPAAHGEAWSPTVKPELSEKRPFRGEIGNKIDRIHGDVRHVSGYVASPPPGGEVIIKCTVTVTAIRLQILHRLSPNTRIDGWLLSAKHGKGACDCGHILELRLAIGKIATDDAESGEYVTAEGNAPWASSRSCL